MRNRRSPAHPATRRPKAGDDATRRAFVTAGAAQARKAARAPRSSTAGPRAGLSLLALILSAGLLLAVPARAEVSPVTVLAAGDVAFCDRSWGRKMMDWLRGYGAAPGVSQTAALLDRLPGALLILGDLVYWRGSAEEFAGCYDPAWGRHKARSYPVPGNHEYRSDAAAPYFDYWGPRAGARGKGYYSFDLGAWHIVALNSNLPMDPGSAQETWLRRDLAASEADCILAYWHHARFSSGLHGDQDQVSGAFSALYAAGASLVLASHDHHYERFAPMDAAGRRDASRGLRSFVVGTGGGQLRPGTIRKPLRDNSEAIDGATWGVLELTLYPKSYAWRFVPVAGQSFTERGRADCVARESAD